MSHEFAVHGENRSNQMAMLAICVRFRVPGASFIYLTPGHCNLINKL